MNWMLRYPTVEDLRTRAKARLPRFAFEYLDSGTGAEECLARNREAFRNITFSPRYLRGRLDPDLSTSLFGKAYQAPFGVAPVGLSALIWPGSELCLAAMAARYGIPYCLSTVGGETIEAIGGAAKGMGWFQLYTPRNKEVAADLLGRAERAGFSTLLVTVDVPVPSRRERMRRAGMSMPPGVSARFVWQAALKPAWTLATLSQGQPRFKTMEPYAPASDLASVAVYVNEQIHSTLDWDYLAWLRDRWKGPLVLKGILSVEDARQAQQAGIDGLLLSNHGGRQLDAAPAPLDMLGPVREAVGSDMALLIDSGLRSGLDVARALALGADFVLLGRAFLYGVAALGPKGGEHAADILIEELRNVMAQAGIERLADLPGALAAAG
jgi:L-lactate dehydrogenase (cytochrome)